MDSQIDFEKIARLIANRDQQILQLSEQLNQHLLKISQLESIAQDLQKENARLKKRLDNKNNIIKQEINDISLLNYKIAQIGKKTWTESFQNLKSWIGDKIPNSLIGTPLNKTQE
jgi:regulator of replication initiation timing